MDISAAVETLRKGQSPAFPAEAKKRGFAEKLDAQDELRHLREEFILPTTKSLRKKALDSKVNGSSPDTAPHCNGTQNGLQNGDTQSDYVDSPSIYLVGNSLGAQPKAVRQYLDAQLETWASIGVNGHFTSLDESPLVSWQDMADDCAKRSTDIVGALPSEIVIMNTLTANLHFMMASFYRPTEKRHKIILEWKPFPSDWYAIESQIRWHGLDPAKSMVEIQPDDNFYIPTEKILSVIDEHASETALLLLPGIQYYSGQLFDIPRITRYAQERGIVVGWDLAHAAGNVELRLHDWNVDFAVWCTYKYINAGPGAIAGAFVHERHGKVEHSEDDGKFVFRPRLAGWYGGDKSVRFNMAKTFQPTPGAGGFQVSNPSAIDLASLSAALSVFNRTSMSALRSKSLLLTAYTEHLLNDILATQSGAGKQPPFRIITPRNPLERGTQLSVLLRPGLLEHVGKALKEGSVVCDQRKPDVIRVAPVPLYCTFLDVWRFAEIFRHAIETST
ncbi:kynureninase [Coniochaeta ligniaria NRRL 30616]|uniref:Kynureninase n=1 Tax=Coniochaeta ligniaria NRRL 30616 TaxID=1408157 RepID=A0A1J7J0X4_9PEZI|nr:kynureninase [Coniochaeta ligniaria NRRL 30616]